MGLCCLLRGDLPPLSAAWLSTFSSMLVVCLLACFPVCCSLLVLSVFLSVHYRLLLLLMMMMLLSVCYVVVVVVGGGAGAGAGVCCCCC